MIPIIRTDRWYEAKAIKSPDVYKHWAFEVSRYAVKVVCGDGVNRTIAYMEHHQFNRKRYWAPRSIRLPDSTGEWMRAQTVAEAVQELYSRFDTAVMIEATKDSLYISEANTPMIFLRYIPRENDDLPVPF